MSPLSGSVNDVTVPSRRIRILRVHNAKTPWNIEERRMNTPKAAWTAAESVESHDRSPERQDIAATSTGWDPYEVWRTRVLKPAAVSDSPAGKGDPLPLPFLIRST